MASMVAIGLVNPPQTAPHLRCHINPQKGAYTRTLTHLHPEECGNGVGVGIR